MQNAGQRMTAPIASPNCGFSLMKIRVLLILKAESHHPAYRVILSTHDSHRTARQNGKADFPRSSTTSFPHNSAPFPTISVLRFGREPLAKLRSSNKLSIDKLRIYRTHNRGSIGLTTIRNQKQAFQVV